MRKRRERGGGGEGGEKEGKREEDDRLNMRRFTYVSGVRSLTAPHDQEGNSLLAGGNAAPPATCTGPKGTVHPATKTPTNLLLLHFAGGGSADVFQPLWSLTDDRNSTLMAPFGPQKSKKNNNKKITHRSIRKTLKISQIFVILIYDSSLPEVTTDLWEHVALESCVSVLLT